MSAHVKRYERDFSDIFAYDHSIGRKTKEDAPVKIILDTDSKTITVPWNYAEKLGAMNRVIQDAMGEDARALDPRQYLQDCWQYAMAHADTHMLTAVKPVKPPRKG